MGRGFVVVTALQGAPAPCIGSINQVHDFSPGLGRWKGRIIQGSPAEQGRNGRSEPWMILPSDDDELRRGATR